MLFRMSGLAAALAVGLMVGSSASAVPMYSDDGLGVTTIRTLGSGAYVVDLVFDTDGLLVNGAQFVVTTTGGVSFTGDPTCVVAGCLAGATAGYPNSGPQSANVTFPVSTSTDFTHVQLFINVGATAGQLLLTGSYLNAGSSTILLAPVVLVNAPIPEPGTLLLLGSGLVGLTLVGRRRA